MAMENKRREFLSITARSGLCVACSGLSGILFSSCDMVEQGDPVITIADEPALQQIGGAVRKRFAAINNGEAIFIIREDAQKFTAYAAQCTHQHVELNLPKEGIIKCPNHGSLFRVSDGSVIDGKAYDPLKRYPVEYDRATQRLRILIPQTDMT
jgi:nitrite reductase/ring-hydroxylating ferredoxin subunit